MATFNTMSPWKLHPPPQSWPTTVIEALQVRQCHQVHCCNIPSPTQINSLSGSGNVLSPYIPTSLQHPFSVHTVGKSGFVVARQNNMLPHSANNCGFSAQCISPHDVSHPTIFDFAGISQTYIQILPPNQLHCVEFCKVSCMLQLFFMTVSKD